VIEQSEEGQESLYYFPSTELAEVEGFTSKVELSRQKATTGQTYEETQKLISNLGWVIGVKKGDLEAT